MSYDLRLGVKVAGTDDLFVVIAEPERSSPTYNLRDMFVNCMDWDYEQGEWYKVSEVYPKIERGILALKNNEEEFMKYNPSNGWGSTKSALAALESLKACIDDVEDPDSWTSWNTVPKEYLYMSW